MPEKPNMLIFLTEQHRGDCLSMEGHPVLMTPDTKVVRKATARNGGSRSCVRRRSQ